MEKAQMAAASDTQKLIKNSPRHQNLNCLTTQGKNKDGKIINGMRNSKKWAAWKGGGAAPSFKDGPRKKTLDSERKKRGT